MGEHKHKNGASDKSGKSDKTDLGCYRAIVCSRGICDQATNLTSYIDVQEDMSFPRGLFGKTILLQGHFGVVGIGEYEIRLVWTSDNGQTQPAGDMTPERIKLQGRQRFAAQALRLPPTDGYWALTLEWRHVGDLAWSVALAHSPIVFTYAPETGASPLVTARA